MSPLRHEILVTHLGKCLTLKRSLMLPSVLITVSGGQTYDLLYLLCCGVCVHENMCPGWRLPEGVS